MIRKHARTGWLLSLMLLWGISVLLMAPLAAAQNKMQLIRQSMEQGLALFVAGKPAEAADVFERAYTAYPYSAFLFNAGVCYQKLGKNSEALAKYRRYLAVDASAPDAEEVRRRVVQLEVEIQRVEDAAHKGTDVPPPGATASDVAATEDSVAPSEAEEVTAEAMRSLVVIETEPVGAPVRVFRPNTEDAPPFVTGGTNPMWTEAVSATSPTSLSLSVGLYQILIDKFRDFNASATQLRVSAGHVHQFKANLSQGDFMGFLRVSANVKGAHIWLDDAKKSHAEWGTTPYGELVSTGTHSLLIDVPGFQPVNTEVTLESGERKEIDVNLVRVEFGTLRVTADAPAIEVLVDGRPSGRWRQGDAPIEASAMAGPHTLTVKSEGRKTFEGEVVIPAGQILPVRVRLIPKYPRGTAWVQAVIGAVFIGGGTYLGIKTENMKDDLDRDRSRGVLSSSDPRIDQGPWFAMGADAAFIVGGTFAALATWNFVRDPLPASSVRPGRVLEFADPLKHRPQGQEGTRSRAVISSRLGGPELPAASHTTLGLGPVNARAAWAIGVKGSF